MSMRAKGRSQVESTESADEPLPIVSWESYFNPVHAACRSGYALVPSAAAKIIQELIEEHLNLSRL
jgi:hypothetical protein